MISNAVFLASMFSLMGITFVLHFRNSGVVNVALIGYVLIAAQILGWLQGDNDGIFWFVICCIIAATTVCVMNFIVDTFLYSPLRSSTPAMKSIASVCVYLFIAAVSTMIFTEDPRPQLPRGLGSIEIGSNEMSYLTLIAVGVSILCISVFFYLYTKTMAGKRFHAVLSDSETALSIGISRRSAEVFLSVTTGVFTTLVAVFALGVLDGKAFAPWSAAFALMGITVAVIARQRNLIVCIIASLCLGFIVSTIWENDDAFVRIQRLPVELVGLSEKVVVTSSYDFALFVIPAFAVVIGLLAAYLWDKETSNG